MTSPNDEVGQVNGYVDGHVDVETAIECALRSDGAQDMVDLVVALGLPPHEVHDALENLEGLHRVRRVADSATETPVYALSGA